MFLDIVKDIKENGFKNCSDINYSLHQSAQMKISFLHSGYSILIVGTARRPDQGIVVEYRDMTKRNDRTRVYIDDMSYISKEMRLIQDVIYDIILRLGYTEFTNNIGCKIPYNNRYNQWEDILKDIKSNISICNEKRIRKYTKANGRVFTQYNEDRSIEWIGPIIFSILPKNICNSLFPRVFNDKFRVMLLEKFISYHNINIESLMDNGNSQTYSFHIVIDKKNYLGAIDILTAPTQVTPTDRQSGSMNVNYALLSDRINSNDMLYSTIGQCIYMPINIMQQVRGINRKKLKKEVIKRELNGMR